MVSNLPLLFAKGKPTSLEMMSLEELQVFLRFMIKCEQNLVEVNLDNLARPEWWPPDTPFDEKLLAQKEQRGKHSVLLRGAIRTCYTQYNCMYLLEFCRKLITFTGGVENLLVVDNCDGTRSLLNRVNRKLLVTFRAENQDYDKAHYNDKVVAASFHKKSPLKPCDSKRLGNVSTTNASDPALSACVDVYLCDTCDKDFDSLEDLIAHEKRCGKQERVSSSSRFPNRDQSSCDKYFSYLKLGRKTGTQTKVRKCKESERPRASSYNQFMDIDIASPLGRYIVTSSGLSLDKQDKSVRGVKTVEEYLSATEQQCSATRTAIRHSNSQAINGKYKFPTTYRTSRKKANSWTHSYCFNQVQKARQLRLIESGLSFDSLKMWRKYRRNPATLKLKRLDPDLVASVKKREEEQRKQDAQLEEKRVKEMEEMEDNRKKGLNTIEEEEDIVELEVNGKNDVELEINLEEGGESESDMDIIPLLSPTIVSVSNSSLPSPRSQPSSSSHRSPSFSHSPPYASPRINQTSSSQKSVRPWAKSSFIVRDEAHLDPPETTRSPLNQTKSLSNQTKPQIRVPRPLPELQRIAAAQPMAIETECIDLCSSDDE